MEVIKLAQSFSFYFIIFTYQMGIRSLFKSVTLVPSSPSCYKKERVSFPAYLQRNRFALLLVIHLCLFLNPGSLCHPMVSLIRFLNQNHVLSKLLHFTSTTLESPYQLSTWLWKDGSRLLILSGIYNH